MKNLFLISLLIIPLEILGCSFAPTSFCKTILAYDDRLIVYGTIISKDDDGLDLEIIETLRGDETKIEIRIWDGQDFDCNGPFDMSVNTIGAINDTIIIALSKIESVLNPWDVIGDYTTPTPYGDTPRIFVKEGLATGFIAGGIYDQNFYEQTIEYEKLKEAIETHGDCDDIQIISSTSKPTSQNEITIENPASSFLYIRQSHSTEIVEVNIYSISGEKLISRKTKDQLEIAISINQLPVNLYVVQMIKLDNTQAIVKLVKI